MYTYTLKDLQVKFKELGYKWPNFHLIGIRSKDYTTNTFCDSFILYNGGQLFRFDGTTRPGSYYLLHILNPKGAAVLKPNQYIDTWSLGFHKNNLDHQALIQVRPVTVYRDGDLDLLPEEQGLQDTGYFGINIHRTTKFGLAKLVDRWSAGCQVFADSDKFASFIDSCKNSNQKFFTYTLLNEWTP